MEKLRPETLCIQAGYTPGNGEPRQLPIIQSTTFKYDTSEQMAERKIKAMLNRLFKTK